MKLFTILKGSLSIQESTALVFEVYRLHFLILFMLMYPKIHFMIFAIHKIGKRDKFLMNIRSSIMSRHPPYFVLVLFS